MIVENRPLLSRVADSVYWMARYIERAENVARFIGVNLHLHLDLPLAPAHQWQPLIETSGDTALFQQRYTRATEDNVIKFLTIDRENPNSIYSCLRGARENARSIRDTISTEMWEQINSMYLQIQAQRPDLEHDSLPEILQGIHLSCHTFRGITDATMTHNEAWHFFRLGRLLERADKTSRILDVKYFILLPSVTGVGSPYDDLHWSAVLKSVSGFEMYRKKHGHIGPRNIVEFLVLDREFPRSIHYCIIGAESSLRAITGTPAGSIRHRSEELMNRLDAELATSVEQVMSCGLHEYLDGLQIKMNAIDASLLGDIFAWQPVTQTQTQTQTMSIGSKA